MVLIYFFTLYFLIISTIEKKLKDFRLFNALGFHHLIILTISGIDFLIIAIIASFASVGISFIVSFGISSITIDTISFSFLFYLLGGRRNLSILFTWPILFGITLINCLSLWALSTVIYAKIIRTERYNCL